ncbi:MAG: MaoC/PaaZ C-terminal domain-containing protein [Archangium sp.]
MASGLALLARAALTRKPALVPEGAKVERLETRLQLPSLGSPKLDAFRRVTGWRASELPLTWPHILAADAVLELLTGSRFPVKLLGLVHVANRIELHAPISVSARAELVVFLEGFKDTERGQEFELHTELHVDGGVPWREVTTFLARKKRSGARTAKEGSTERATPERVVDFEAPSGLGREYGKLAGDLNPIHLSDLSAKLFGFPRAIAHGMWSLARIAAELKLEPPCVVECQFKLPVLLPSKLKLELAGESFTLLDATSGKPHVVGTCV